jgi:hypothetical protein
MEVKLCLPSYGLEHREKVFHNAFLKRGEVRGENWAMKKLITCIKKSKVGGARSIYGRERSSYRILVGKPKGEETTRRK